MMYRARAEAVDGLRVQAGGKWLTCIGNKPVKVGDAIWTDGRCVYGRIPITAQPFVPTVPVKDDKIVIPIIWRGNLMTYIEKGKLEFIDDGHIQRAPFIFVSNKYYAVIWNDPPSEITYASNHNSVVIEQIGTQKFRACAQYLMDVDVSPDGHVFTLFSNGMIYRDVEVFAEFHQVYADLVSSFWNAQQTVYESIANELPPGYPSFTRNESYFFSERGSTENGRQHFWFPQIDAQGNYQLTVTLSHSWDWGFYVYDTVLWTEGNKTCYRSETHVGRVLTNEAVLIRDGVKQTLFKYTYCEHEMDWATELRGNHWADRTETLDYELGISLSRWVEQIDCEPHSIKMPMHQNFYFTFSVDAQKLKRNLRMGNYFVVSYTELSFYDADDRLLFSLTDTHSQNFTFGNALHLLPLSGARFLILERTYPHSNGGTNYNGYSKLWLYDVDADELEQMSFRSESGVQNRSLYTTKLSLWKKILKRIDV